MSDHVHDPHSGSKTRLIIMFILTFTYMLAELVVGYIGQSTSLIADAFHMLSDVISLTVAFMAIKLSPKKWDKSTFGWARAEVLGALVNAVFLLALCFTIFIESIKRFFEPQRVKEPVLVFAVGLGGLIINIIGLCIFHEKEKPEDTHEEVPGVGKRKRSLIQNQGRLTRMVGADQITNEDGSVLTVAPGISKSSLVKTTSIISPGTTQPPPTSAQPSPESAQGSQEASRQPSHGNLPASGSSAHHHGSSQMNIKGVFLHILADALGSVIVVISASIVWGTEEMRKNDEANCVNVRWWAYIDYIDPALSTILVILIVFSSWPLLQEASLILLQTVPARINVEELKGKIITDVKGVLAVHEFHIWELAGNKIIASIHIVCENINDYTRITREVKDLFRKEGIRSTTVQAEFANEEAFEKL